MNRVALRQLLGGWNFAFTFRREVSCVLDVSYVAEQRFLPRLVTNLDGALLDDLLQAAFFSRLSEANCRAVPSNEVSTTNNSLTGAGACSTPLSRDYCGRLVTSVKNRDTNLLEREREDSRQKVAGHNEYSSESTAEGCSAKGRSSSRTLNYVLKKLSGLCLSADLAVEPVWIPS